MNKYIEEATDADVVDDIIDDLLPKEDISDVSTATKDVLDPGISDSADVSALHAPDNTDQYKPTEPVAEPREEAATSEDEVDAVIDTLVPDEDVSDISTATTEVLDPEVKNDSDVSAVVASDNTDSYKPVKPEVQPREESFMDILSAPIY